MQSRMIFKFSTIEQCMYGTRFSGEPRLRAGKTQKSLSGIRGKRPAKFSTVSLGLLLQFAEQPQKWPIASERLEMGIVTEQWVIRQTRAPCTREQMNCFSRLSDSGISGCGCMPHMMR